SDLRWGGNPQASRPTSLLRIEHGRKASIEILVTCVQGKLGQVEYLVWIGLETTKWIRDQISERDLRHERLVGGSPGRSWMTFDVVDHLYVASWFSRSQSDVNLDIVELSP